MGKRWAFSESKIHFDPGGTTSTLLAEKVPLKPGERTWLMISGLTLSEWYVNRLTRLWIDRGSVLSAHNMFSEGLNQFYAMLFSLNNQLTADHKWRLFYAEQLTNLPKDFESAIGNVMRVQALDEAEIVRRRDAFMGMWEEMLPKIENETGMKYQDFKDTV